MCRVFCGCKLLASQVHSTSSSPKTCKAWHNAPRATSACLSHWRKFTAAATAAQAACSPRLAVQSARTASTGPLPAQTAPHQCTTCLQLQDSASSPHSAHCRSCRTRKPCSRGGGTVSSGPARLLNTACHASAATLWRSHMPLQRRSRRGLFGGGALAAVGTLSSSQLASASAAVPTQPRRLLCKVPAPGMAVRCAGVYREQHGHPLPPCHRVRGHRPVAIRHCAVVLEAVSVAPQQASPPDLPPCQLRQQRIQHAEHMIRAARAVAYAAAHVGCTCACWPRSSSQSSMWETPHCALS